MVLNMLNEDNLNLKNDNQKLDNSELIKLMKDYKEFGSYDSRNKILISLNDTIVLESKRIFKKYSQIVYGIELCELINEAFLISITIIDNFDINSSINFEQFFKKRLQIYLLNYLKNYSAIKYLRYDAEIIFRLKKLMYEYYSVYHEYPDLKKLSILTSISENVLEKYLSFINTKSKKEPHQIISQTNFLNSDEYINAVILTKNFLEKSHITDYQKKIIGLKIGLYNNQPYSIAEIAKILGKSYSAVNDSYYKALIRLEKILSKKSMEENYESKFKSRKY